MEVICHICNKGRGTVKFHTVLEAYFIHIAKKYKLKNKYKLDRSRCEQRVGLPTDFWIDHIKLINSKMKIVNLSENEWNIFAAPGSWTQVAWAMSTDSRFRTLMLNRSRYLILKQITYSESVKGSLSSSLKKYKKNKKLKIFIFWISLQWRPDVTTDILLTEVH